jgi:hypothetical protein
MTLAVAMPTVGHLFARLAAHMVNDSIEQKMRLQRVIARHLETAYSLGESTFDT